MALDADGDGKECLAEVIRALQLISGLTGEENSDQTCSGKRNNDGDSFTDFDDLISFFRVPYTVSFDTMVRPLPALLLNLVLSLPHTLPRLPV
ncbi:hypothetical protein [Desulfopila sp. IMCC35008]|uniref:hypothetical protein n=1 Tax=Desulfopila sp. IMCC35008 TaxID=2653858 RepID=UPI0013D2B62A|nr:hypothetical protein [Desulfopila sp. IMCC35008]